MSLSIKIATLGSIFAAALLALTFTLPAEAQYVSPSYYSPTPSCPTLSYNLYRGLSDRYTQGQVTQLQQFLVARYPGQGVTGYFGAQTQGNVARFQQEQGVYPVTGGVGPLTRAAIARVCGGGVTPGSSVFYLNTPFTLSAGQTVKQFQGQLDFTLTRINTSPYTLYTYPGYSPVTSATINLGQSCPQGSYCAYLWYPQQSFDLTVGQTIIWQGYSVTLISLNQTNATFSVTTNVPGEQASVTVSLPTQGRTVSHGQSLPIQWSLQNTPSNSSSVVDLYTVGGSKVGTIAIQSTASSVEYNWTVPTPNTMCTMQYPNALCGQSLSGQYYIKVSVVSGSGFDANPTTYASGNSGTFTVTSGSQQTTGFSASPTFGYAPLMTNFTVTQQGGLYKIDFGDGTSQQVTVPTIYCIQAPCNPPPQTVSHTYATRGTYTATLMTDASCFYSTPRCMIPVQYLGSATVTVY